MNRLQSLRQLMLEHRIDTYIVGTFDPHNSEYLGDYFKSREWITGFTGSQGTAVITLDKAYVWADGRYFIQAEQQIKETGFELMKLNTPGYPSVVEWIGEHVDDMSIMGFHDQVFPQHLLDEIEKELDRRDKHVVMIGDKDLIGMLWEDRPLLPRDKAFLLDVAYTGKSAAEKLAMVREKMNKVGADELLMTTLDDIAWLFNLRGRDLPEALMVMAYARINHDEAYLYIDRSKLTDEIKENLEEQGVTVNRYYAVFEDLSKLTNQTIWVDAQAMTVKMNQSIPASVRKYEAMLPTTLLKALKNEIEIKNLYRAYEADGLALIKMHAWLKKNVAAGKQITEHDVENKLEEMRSALPDYLGVSFTTISAYGPNAAMMHYHAEEETAATIEPKSFHLVDAGAQFLYGTTDTTRTIAMGPLTKEEIRDYTLTLKGHIALVRAKFLKGTCGHSLDVLARQPLWQEGIDYKCGTGHGIGFVLNVHEGPQRIAQVTGDAPLMLGMVTSVEPGVYRENKHGIRLENIVVVTPFMENNGDVFYQFETMSYVPFEREAIDVTLLNEEELMWINKYHHDIYELYKEQLEGEELSYLERVTAPLV